MHPDLLAQLAEEHARDLVRARPRHVVEGSRRPTLRGRVPLRPVGVAFVRVGLWLVAPERPGHVPAVPTPAR